MSHPNEFGKVVIPISEIIIGERIRQEAGDIEVLALSISLHSLIDPIIVHETERGRYELVDGYRRILAHKKMGKKDIEARLFSTLDDETKFQLELELCLRRKSLSFVEEARACKRILLEKRRHSTIGGIGRFTGMVKNKDIAMQLGMSESSFSVNLKIADALDSHPELECIKTRNELLTKINKQEYTVVNDGTAMKIYQESYVVDTPINLVSAIGNKMIDLALLHPTLFDEELVETLIPKLKMGGSVIIFMSHEFFPAYKNLLESLHIYVAPTPYIWYIKNEDTYLPFLWAGKSREMPLRMMPLHITVPRSKTALSLKAKPYNLISTLVKNNTEPGHFVVSTHCEDLDTIRFCMDSQRNVRAATTDKILRDRLLMTIGKQGDIK